MKKISGIYQITNKINGCIYIGSSVDIRARITDHRSSLNCKRHNNVYLQNAWNKYGKDNFSFKILLYCDVKNLYYYEQLCIDNLHPGYNIAICVKAPMLGRTASEETRKKMCDRVPWNKGKTGLYVASEEARRNISKAKTGTHLSDETRAKISETHKGKHPSEKTKEKMRARMKGSTGLRLGKHHTEEAKRKMSEAHKGKPLSEEHIRNASEAHRGKTYRKSQLNSILVSDEPKPML